MSAASLWERLATDASGLPWADLTDDVVVDVLQQAVDAAEGQVLSGIGADPQWPEHGTCAVCSLRCKRQRWGDRWHWSTNAHCDAVAWAQRKLDMRTWYAACPAPAGSQSRQNSDIWVEEFLPLSHLAGDEVHVFFLVGSFQYMKTGTGK